MEPYGPISINILSIFLPSSVTHHPAYATVWLMGNLINLSICFCKVWLFRSRPTPGNREPSHKGRIWRDQGNHLIYLFTPRTPKYIYIKQNIGNISKNWYDQIGTSTTWGLFCFVGASFVSLGWNQYDLGQTSMIWVGTSMTWGLFSAFGASFLFSGPLFCFRGLFSFLGACLVVGFTVY